jgi:hypothetical protein
LKSALAKPVVVIIVTVLNTALRTAGSPLKMSARSSATSTTADAHTSRTTPTRASSSRRSARGLRPTIAANSSAKFVPATTMKNTTTHCVAGANGSSERGSGEKPAVAIVANA